MKSSAEILTTFRQTSVEASFFQWLRRSGVMLSDNVEVDRFLSGSGYCLRARRDIEPGSMLMSVPPSVWLPHSSLFARKKIQRLNPTILRTLTSISTTMMPQSPALAENLVESSCLALLLMSEMPPSSSPYIRLLMQLSYPQMKEAQGVAASDSVSNDDFNEPIVHPLLMSEDLYLRPLLGETDTFRALQRRLKMFRYIACSLFGDLSPQREHETQRQAMHPHDQCFGTTTLDLADGPHKDFMWAMGNVLSRAISRTKSEQTVLNSSQPLLCMVPLLDFANHSNEHDNAEHAFIPFTTPSFIGIGIPARDGAFGEETHSSAYVLESTSHITAGEEIRISYGKQRDSTSFMAIYGFLGGVSPSFVFDSSRSEGPSAVDCNRRRAINGQLDVTESGRDLGSTKSESKRRLSLVDTATTTARNRHMNAHDTISISLPVSSSPMGTKPVPAEVQRLVRETLSANILHKPVVSQLAAVHTAGEGSVMTAQRVSVHFNQRQNHLTAVPSASYSTDETRPGGAEAEDARRVSAAGERDGRARRGGEREKRGKAGAVELFTVFRVPVEALLAGLDNSTPGNHLPLKDTPQESSVADRSVAQMTEAILRMGNASGEREELSSSSSRGSIQSKPMSEINFNQDLGNDSETQRGERGRRVQKEEIAWVRRAAHGDAQETRAGARGSRRRALLMLNRAMVSELAVSAEPLLAPTNPFYATPQVHRPCRPAEPSLQELGIEERGGGAPLLQEVEALVARLYEMLFTCNVGQPAVLKQEQNGCSRPKPLQSASKKSGFVQNVVDSEGGAVKGLATEKAERGGLSDEGLGPGLLGGWERDCREIVYRELQARVSLIRAAARALSSLN